MRRPTRKELVLAIEALVALVDREYESFPLAEIAFIHGGRTVTKAHSEALRNVEASLFGPESSASRSDDLL